jgi:hypothetical protein
MAKKVNKTASKTASKAKKAAKRSKTGKAAKTTKAAKTAKTAKAAAKAKPAKKAKAVKKAAAALPSFPAGMQMVYGIGIGDALAAAAGGRASADDLVALRDQARTIVGAQGDLVEALKALDAELSRRGAAAAAAPVVERFVAQIDGVALPAKVKDEIEHAIQLAIAPEIARIDTGGDMVETPLSRLGKFGDGIGARTPGRYLVNKNLNLG